MDSDWVSAAIAAVSAVAAVASWYVAARANRRAKDALDLQRRIDARAAEFRDVRWIGKYEPGDAPTFWLKQVGLTTAMSVTLVLDTNHGEGRVFDLGTIPPRGERKVTVQRWAYETGLTDVGWRVYWSSPLGKAQKFKEPYLSAY